MQWEPNKAETEWFHEAMHTATAAISDDEATAYHALTSYKAENGKAGKQEELAQIEKLVTWEVVEAPRNANILLSRWVLCQKRNALRVVACHCARIVAKGYKQIFGVDFKETFEIGRAHV